MPWFLTPHGPHFVVEPGTIDEYERRDYVVMTAQQVTDYYAGVATPDPPSFATEAEVPGIVASAVQAGTGPISDALRTAFRRRPVTIDDLPTTGLRSAHRGSSREARPVAPEGSLSAYRLAVALGAHIIDVDNQMTSDGVPVAIHDTTVDATTASTGDVATFPMHMLPQLSMPELVGPGWAPEPMPTVEQIFAEFGGRVCITVEPKGGGNGIPYLVALIKRFGLERSVYINTPNTFFAQMITDAGCLAHVYGITDNAGIDAAVAAGADLIELPYNASTALVDHAVASGVHRFIAGPIYTYAQLEAMDPRFNGYVNNAVGYLGRPGGKAQRSVSSLAMAIASGRRGAGWRLERSSGTYSDWMVQGGGLRIRRGADFLYVMYGDLSGTPATSGSVTFTVNFPTLPTDTSQRIGLRIFCPEEDTQGFDANTKGYVVSLRANGQLNMWSSPLGAYGGGVALGTAPTGAALVANTDYQVTFEWTATQVRATRVDTGGTTGWVNNTDWRAPFIHTVWTLSTGEALMKNIVVS